MCIAINNYTSAYFNQVTKKKCSADSSLIEFIFFATRMQEDLGLSPGGGSQLFLTGSTTMLVLFIKT